MRNIFKNITLAALLSLSVAQPLWASQVTSMTHSAGVSGTDFRTKQNDINNAFNTLQKGSSRPVTAVAGSLWLDDSGGASSWLVKFYDGSADITIGTLNTSADTFVPSGQLATFANAVSAKTGTFTSTVSDYGKFLTADATSASFTANIDDAATLGTSWYVIIQKIDTSSNTITIDPNSTQTVNGSSTYVITKQYEGVILIKTSSTALRALPFGNTNVVKVSSSDTTAGFLNDKISAGNGIAKAITSGGSNEGLSISASLATDPGLEFNSGGLRVKNTTGITRTSSGIGVDSGTTAGKVVVLDGSARLPAVDGSQLTGISGVKSVYQQVFTSSGTYTPVTGMVYATIECVGGGGGGSGVSGAAGAGGGSGGGAGGYSRGVYSAATIGASRSITIGSGGSGGAFNTSGTGGGNTVVTGIQTCNGGSGGAVGTGGDGGGASGGTLSIAGGQGMTSISGLGASSIGGHGGSSFFGGGARAVTTATAYGAGGGGANTSVSGSGSGAAGVVVITEYSTQ